MQVAGTTTIVNTGKFPIKQGQKVCWDVPRISRKRDRDSVPRGEPSSKILFETVALDHLMPMDIEAPALADDKNFGDYIGQLHAVAPHADPAGPNKTKAQEILRRLFKAVMDAPDVAGREQALLAYNRAILYGANEVYSRVIGIALSNAAPGESFDILIQAVR